MQNSRDKGKGRAHQRTEPEGYYKGEPTQEQIALVEAELANGKLDYWFWLQRERRASKASLLAAFRHYTKRVHTDHNRHGCAQLVIKIVLAAKQSLMTNGRERAAYARALDERQKSLGPEQRRQLLHASECVRGAVLHWYERDAKSKSIVRKVKRMMDEASARISERLSTAKRAAGAAAEAANAAAQAAQVAWDTARQKDFLIEATHSGDKVASCDVEAERFDHYSRTWASWQHSTFLMQAVACSMANAACQAMVEQSKRDLAKESGGRAAFRACGGASPPIPTACGS